MLTLSSCSVNFEPVNKLCDVFYDNVNKKVVTVRGCGAIGLTARGPSPSNVVSFKLADKGNIFSIKLSSNLKVVAVQRSPAIVEFANIINSEAETAEYAQSCKGKNTRIIGLEWTSHNEILFVTDLGLELYQVLPEKHCVRPIKVHNVALNWYVYSPELHYLVVSTGTLGTVLQPFSVQSSLMRLPKFEVDLAFNPLSPKLTLLDRDVAIVSLYGTVYVLVLRHMPKNRPNGAEIFLYNINNLTKHSYVLQVGSQGKFAVHVIDDLIIVHQQEAKVSILFDINSATVASRIENAAIKINPALPPLPISLPESISSDPASTYHKSVELYAASWVIFQPNVIIDAKIGCMWNVELNLNRCVKLFKDKCTCVDFLLRRQNARPLILVTLIDYLNSQQLSLSEISKIWDSINSVFKTKLDKSKTGEPKNIIGQPDLYTHVFFPVSDNEKTDSIWFSNVIIEYLLSLQKLQISVQPFVQELLVTSLIKSKQYDKLDQLIRYRVINDSKPMAFLLLSLESSYPAALQLALGLLSRRSSAIEEVVEILLSKHKVIEALRYVQSFGIIDKMSPLKFIEAAWQTGDKHMFFVIFSFFEQQAIKRSGTSYFAKGDQFDRYLLEYRKITNLR